MNPNATVRSIQNQEAAFREKIQSWMSDKPLLSTAAAAAAGMVLGGCVFSRLGRLAFLVAAGYAANELWRREGRVRLSDLMSDEPDTSRVQTS